MNIISQNCLSADLYKNHFKTEYQTPFVWCVIDFNNMIKLIDNFDKLNFLNFELIKDKNWKFSIKIDNTVTVQYVHYRFNRNYNKPTQIGVNVFSNKIWEYIVVKYIERTKRMLTLNQKPIFCFCNFISDFPDSKYTEEQFKILEKYPNVKILKNTEKLEHWDAAKLFYKTFFSTK